MSFRGLRWIRTVLRKSYRGCGGEVEEALDEGIILKTIITNKVLNKTQKLRDTAYSTQCHPGNDTQMVFVKRGEKDSNFEAWDR